MATRNCDNCGTELNRPPSHLRGKHTFCNRECRKKFYRPTFQCAGCGEGVERNPKTPNTKYCSWECFKESRHVLIKCEVCGKEFDSYLSEMRKREARGHVAVCSADCRNVYTSKLLGGDGNWKPGGKHSRSNLPHGWRKARASYLARLSDDMCELCGGEPIAEVHHLHPRGLGGDLVSHDNLVACCKSCHLNMHEQLDSGFFEDSFEGSGREDFYRYIEWQGLRSAARR